METIWLILAFLPLALVGVVLVWAQHSMADGILQGWARAAGVMIVSAQKRYLRTGPFFLDHWRGQFVFRIVVKDQTGMERAGWLRVGGCLAGVLSPKTKVIWDT